MEGKCPKCKRVYVGWGVIRMNKCPNCKTPLDIHLTPHEKSELKKFKRRVKNE